MFLTKLSRKYHRIQKEKKLQEQNNQSNENTTKENASKSDSHRNVNSLNVSSQLVLHYSSSNTSAQSSNAIIPIKHSPHFKQKSIDVRPPLQVHDTVPKINTTFRQAKTGNNRFLGNGAKGDANSPTRFANASPKTGARKSPGTSLNVGKNDQKSRLNVEKNHQKSRLNIEKNDPKSRLNIEKNDPKSPFNVEKNHPKSRLNVEKNDRMYQLNVEKNDRMPRVGTGVSSTESGPSDRLSLPSTVTGFVINKLNKPGMKTDCKGWKRLESTHIDHLDESKGHNNVSVFTEDLSAIQELETSCTTYHTARNSMRPSIDSRRSSSASGQHPLAANVRKNISADQETTVPGLKHRRRTSIQSTQSRGKRKSILGRNEVILLTSDSDPSTDDENVDPRQSKTILKSILPPRFQRKNDIEEPRAIIQNPSTTSPETSPTKSISDLMSNSRISNVKNWIVSSPFQSGSENFHRLEDVESPTEVLSNTKTSNRLSEESRGTSNAQFNQASFCSGSRLQTADSTSSDFTKGVHRQRIYPVLDAINESQESPYRSQVNIPGPSNITVQNRLYPSLHDFQESSKAVLQPSSEDICPSSEATSKRLWESVTLSSRTIAESQENLPGSEATSKRLGDSIAVSSQDNLPSSEATSKGFMDNYQGKICQEFENIGTQFDVSQITDNLSLESNSPQKEVTRRSTSAQVSFSDSSSSADLSGLRRDTALQVSLTSDSNRQEVEESPLDDEPNNTLSQLGDTKYKRNQLGNVLFLSDSESLENDNERARPASRQHISMTSEEDPSPAHTRASTSSQKEKSSVSIRSSSSFENLLNDRSDDSGPVIGKKVVTSHHSNLSIRQNLTSDDSGPVIGKKVVTSHHSNLSIRQSVSNTSPRRRVTPSKTKNKTTVTSQNTRQKDGVTSDDSESEFNIRHRKFVAHYRDVTRISSTDSDSESESVKKESITSHQATMDRLSLNLSLGNKGGGGGRKIDNPPIELKTPPRHTQVNYVSSSGSEMESIVKTRRKSLNTPRSRMRLLGPVVFDSSLSSNDKTPLQETPMVFPSEKSPFISSRRGKSFNKSPKNSSFSQTPGTSNQFGNSRMTPDFHNTPSTLLLNTPSRSVTGLAFPDDICVTPNTPSHLIKPRCDFTPSEDFRTPMFVMGKLSFLTSLSFDEPNERCHPQAVRYVTKYKQYKNQLLAKLFQLFNQKAFDSCLPTDLQITWNPRLTKTAGVCIQRRVQHLNSGKEERLSRIELSTKVLDSADRLRDTLIHEMCHAASWIISGYRDGHGPIWKGWAKKAMDQFSELPMIARCHAYPIRTKYSYRCMKCQYQIGRHSKSIDITTQCCGLCRGRFELLVNGKVQAQKPNLESGNSGTPNRFALFVKENYKNCRTPGKTHSEAMKELSQQFAQAKLSAQND